MKTKKELNKDILETTANIQENYPELTKFADEMTVTIPAVEDPQINEATLSDYNNSLQTIVAGYAQNSQNAKKNIVIIGAGFAGLKLARTLNNHPNYHITLIDKNNYHQFQPLFYQVAMANLDASNISFPLRNIFQKSKNVTIRVTEVTSIEASINMVFTTNGNFSYDYLVIATGAVTNYFGNAAIEQYSYPMKNTWEALQIRNTLLTHFETAITANSLKVQQLLSIVIVGGGPTGVELSGALAEMKTDTLPLEYPELNFAEMKIYLLEGSAKLLGAMTAASSAKARDYLEDLGVTVMLNTMVKEYNGRQLLLQDGNILESTFVIWAAGVIGNVPQGISPEFVSKSSQIPTDAFHKVIGLNNVYALGDVALMASDQYPKGYPQLASVAIDQAVNLSNNFLCLPKNKPLIPFEYTNKGTMATVGRNKAVVDLAKPFVSFHGFFAWLIWMTLHLFLLIGFKNRVIVFINWIYKYLTHQQSLALLFPNLHSKNKT